MSELVSMFDTICFETGRSTYWSPANNTVYYKNNPSQKDIISVLHEIGHALLEHKSYVSDFDLLLKESAAWERAKLVGNGLDIRISDDHIQECLDTYRDWLHQRSMCPTCKQASLQINRNTYVCAICGSRWSVSNSRFCRSYRRKLK
jgi:hypothetical protein